jgi:hypothetical protein
MTITRRTLQIFAVVYAVPILFAAYRDITIAVHADPQARFVDTRTMMGRVEAVLVGAGYAGARGYASLPPPDVAFAVGGLPRGAWGWSSPEMILLSPDQPEGCLVITLAHEVAHDAVRRRGLLDLPARTPAWVVRYEMERIASVVERAIEADGPLAPNCFMRRAEG